MKKYLIMVAIFAIALISTSCKSDDDDSTQLESNGLTKDINDIIPQEYIDELEEKGFVINKGTNPPNVENAYIFSPVELVESSRPSDDKPGNYYDLYFNFSNQNNSKLTVDFAYINGGSIGDGSGAFIVGEGNKFTAFLEAKDNRGIISTFAYSGELTQIGIRNIQLAFVMIDNNNQPDTIDDGDMRIFEDGDGMTYLYDYFEEGIEANDNNSFKKAFMQLGATSEK